MPMPRKQRNTCRSCGQQITHEKHSLAVYCSHDCQWERRKRAYLEGWKEGRESGNGVGVSVNLSEVVRGYIMEKYDRKCALCGWCGINPKSGRSPLTVHHIDGDALNSSEDNLILLCPNCHSLTPTYGSLNKDSARSSRRKQKGP
jgi:predicted restriction endonuclease